MSVKVIKTDIHVRVDLRDSGDYGFFRISNPERAQARLLQDAENLAKQIRLRMDKWEDGRGDVSVIWTTKSICEHCGADWTENTGDYNGGCCSMDVEPPREEYADNGPSDPYETSGPNS